MSLTILGDLTRRLDARRGACALIAIKARSRCKTRLAQVLTPQSRMDLVRSMLASVLAAAGDALTIRQVIVVSPERDLVPENVPVLADTGKSLNDALIQAHRLLREFGCREVVILPADLPSVTGTDIDILVQAARSGGFALAPDSAGTGTNALCLVSAQPFRFQFGPDSQRMHLDEARRLELAARVVRLPGLSFDVDSPADLDALAGFQWLARRA
jgi:2-phospho-L-lactate/phosphoenolpyruvate guanylyltransferase